MTAAELYLRLSAMPRSCRRIDAELACLFVHPGCRAALAGERHGATGAVADDVGLVWTAVGFVPAEPYTAALERAVALAECELPGWRVDYFRHDIAVAKIGSGIRGGRFGREFEAASRAPGTAGTAIAILGALCKARVAGVGRGATRAPAAAERRQAVA